MADGRRQIRILCSLRSAFCRPRKAYPSGMASKKKWLGLAVIGGFLLAMFKRKKQHEVGGESVEGSIET